MVERLKRLESQHVDATVIKKSLIQHRDAFLAYKQQEFLRAGILNSPPPVVSSGRRGFASRNTVAKLKANKKLMTKLFKKKTLRWYRKFTKLKEFVEKSCKLLREHKSELKPPKEYVKLMETRERKKLILALKKKKQSLLKYDYNSRIRVHKQQADEIELMKKQLPKDFQQRLPSPLQPNIELLDLEDTTDMPLLTTSENNLIEAITKLHSTTITADEYSTMFPHHNISFFNPLTYPHSQVADPRRGKIH